MQIERPSETRLQWSAWAETLRRRGLGNLAAWLLEAAGPLAALGVQLLYLGGPLLRPSLSNRRLDSLAGLLEDDEALQAFTARLREEKSP